MNTKKPIEHVDTDAAQHHAILHNRAVLNTSIDDSEYQRLVRENAALRAKCAEYETLLGVRLREIKAALEADESDSGETYDYE